MGIDTKTYLALSIVMFLEYAVWGAWAPVLAARLLGPLKMSGKQTGWIYATLPLACLVAPLISGWLADQWLNIEWILIGCHLIGAVLLFMAAGQDKFKPLLIVMFGYSFCYAATLPLVNSVLFNATNDIGTQGKVFIWAPIAWALIGWTLTAWRMTRKKQGDGRDCLYYAAALSLVMVVCCFMLPANAPKGTGHSILESVQLLGDPSFLLFVVISIAVAGMMQFYFLGSAQFMQDSGIASKMVPASMALAQIVQAAATYFLLGYFIEHIGFKWTLVIGGTSWLVMYGLYVVGQPKQLIIAAQPLHGLAYVFFMIVGQIYAESVAPEAIRSSMQALIFAATTGVGMFLGTQFAGVVMDKFSVDGKFVWQKVWLVPGFVTLAGVVAMAALFHEKAADTEQPAQDEVAVVRTVDSPPLAVSGSDSTRP